MSSVEELIDKDEVPQELPRRLCSEIQLFDLCELEKCHFKDDRFCTDPEMLARFEAAAEPEERPAWHFGKDEDQDNDDECYTEEQEDDDNQYSVFDDEDRSEQDDEW
ncbi:hypothetical protein FY034_08905 [Trichlorobacter lovleyi]|uniref:hypothetical protein n=1 Tax=Trichlorobacter lovleyi TaxID=313985 RepID=UPI00223F6415|nr:hypothetical protein [Trichlorobacter lovleyi]QOX79041.1 hypothetical protein FY034_08905 [Trichlorobacter lovleyi]